MTPEQQSKLAFSIACIALAFSVCTFIVRGLLYGVFWK